MGGGLGSGASLKMAGVQRGHSREKRGILELNITKKHIFFKNKGLEYWNKELYIFETGSFRAAQVEKIESLGAAKAEKWGAFARHIPVLSLNGSTPTHPAPSLGAEEAPW